MSESGLVKFICANPKHSEVAPGRTDHLTINEGVWAFCPGDSALDGHVWEPTGGLSIEHVVRPARAREAPREAAP